MDDTLQFLLSVLGGALGAAVAYWFWLRQHWQEIRGQYDQELRTARRPLYLTLWAQFEPLAVYAPEENITYKRIAEMGVALRKWYFHDGGLLFTERARDTYFLVQDAIDRVAQLPSQRTAFRPITKHWTRTQLDFARKRLQIRKLQGADDPRSDFAAWHDATSEMIDRWAFGAVADDDYVLLQFLASSLRTLLAEELHTRNRSILDRA